MAANHTTQALLELGTARLAGHSESAGLDAELLLAHVLSVPRARFRSHPEDVPAESAQSLYVELIARRARGEPLAYIVGYRDFWTLKLAVSPAVLVPRPETELLVERALAVRADLIGNVVDLGTGSGAIALALASERPGWQVAATDVSADALAVARANAASHALTRVEFLQGSWFEPLAGRRFHLIVSNPPYIGADEPEMTSPALRHEPRGALTPTAFVEPRGATSSAASAGPTSLASAGSTSLASAGPTSVASAGSTSLASAGSTSVASAGSTSAAATTSSAAPARSRSEARSSGTPSTLDALACLRAIIQSAPPHLEPGGWLLLEHGSTQATQVARALVERGFRHVRSHRDLAGHERMTEGQWPRLSEEPGSRAGPQ